MGKVEVFLEQYERGLVKAVPSPAKILGAIWSAVLLIEIEDALGLEVPAESGGAGCEADTKSVGKEGFTSAGFASESNEGARGDEVGDQPIHWGFLRGEEIDNRECGEIWIGHKGCRLK